MISGESNLEVFVTSTSFHASKLKKCEATGFTFTLVGLAVILEFRTGFALVVIRTAAVEVAHQAVALGLVVTRVWATGVILQLQEEKQKMHDFITCNALTSVYYTSWI